MRTPLKVLALTMVLTPGLVRAQNQSLNQSFAASSAGSTAQSVEASQVSSTVTLIIVGAGLLAGVGGGITTTVYRKRDKANARAQPPPTVLPPPDDLPPPSPPPLPEPTPVPPPPISKRAAPTLDAMVLARSWLLANEVQLKQDLALGAGPALDDLAGVAGIAPARRAHFGRVLQRHRDRLVVSHDVTPEQAAEVMSRVGDLVLADPILRADGEAVIASL